jgi:cytochrome b6-f complex iron-sulfur subunit
MPKSLPRVDQVVCSRRAVLESVGGAIIGGLFLSGCMTSGANVPSAATTMCGSSICIDLTSPANSALTTVGGALAIDTSNDTILIARVSETQVVALSAICTHAGCVVDYNSSTTQLDCPCHGSVFKTDGSVVRGPARSALKVYAATLSSNSITVVA